MLHFPEEANFCNVAAAMQGGVAVNCIVSNNASGTKGVTLRDVKRIENSQLYGINADAAGVCVGCAFRGLGAAVDLAEGANVYTSGTFAVANAMFSTSQGSGMSATNCLFEGNVAETLIYRGNDGNGRVVQFVNCTIVSNRYDCLFSSLVNGGKINDMLFENCIVANNLCKNGTEVRNFYSDLVNEDYVTVRNCLFGSGFKSGWSCPNESNVWTNDVVRFVGTSDPKHPFSLKVTSPARDKGVVGDWMADAYDIRSDVEDGKYRRLRDGKCDLGCYQCWLDPAGMTLLVR